MTLSSSPAQISADGSVTATITAVAKDSSNNVVSGATVAFASTAGTITVTSATTDSSGQATATLSGSGVATGTSITVTATTGSVKATTVVTVGAIQQTIALTTSLPQIPSDDSKTATITALLRDANNNVIPGVVVSFVSTSGVLQVTQAMTDATGAALATLSPGLDTPGKTNRTITVTATAGAATASIAVSVVGTTLSVKGSPTLVLNSSGTYTVAIADASNAGIANVPVTLKSALGNTLSSTSVTTDATGQKAFTVTATKSGTDTITATALGIASTQTIAVSAQNFAFTTPSSSVASTNVDLTTTAKPVNQTLTVVWTIDGVPQTNKAITFAATRGTLSSSMATTDSTGSATVTISSTVAGPATVTASATGVTTQTALEFIATDPSVIDLQASPATISTLGQSTIAAVVRDASNNLVEGQTVTFQTVGDVTGGSLSVASAITDVNGRAQTVYTASSTPSATNGVVVQATVLGTNVSTTTDLTVGGLAVGLSLGKGSTLTELPAGCNEKGCTEFSVPFVVLATDSAGHPVGNVAVTLTIHALDYIKGQYQEATTPYSHDYPAYGAYCNNEDDSQTVSNNPATNASFANFNGILDPGEDGCGIVNGVAYPSSPVVAPYTCNPTGNLNGKLDPGATAVASPGNVTTDATGSVNFNVIYPESIATWVDVELIATATVSGTETSASVIFNLPILADYLKGPGDPPGQPSPYGIATSCTDPN
jgi:hypothetical protein